MNKIVNETSFKEVLEMFLGETSRRVLNDTKIFIVLDACLLFSLEPFCWLSPFCPYLYRPMPEGIKCHLLLALVFGCHWESRKELFLLAINMSKGNLNIVQA